MVPSFQRNLADQEMPQGTQLSQLLQEGCVPQFGEKYWVWLETVSSTSLSLLRTGCQIPYHMHGSLEAKGVGFQQSALSWLVSVRTSKETLSSFLL